jgi:hypothetical protein
MRNLTSHAARLIAIVLQVLDQIRAANVFRSRGDTNRVD